MSRKSWPAGLKKEYYDFCRECMTPSEVLNIQSTAILNLKFMQQYYFQQERNAKFMNKVSLFFTHNTEAVNVVPYLVNYTPPPIHLSLLSDAVELIRKQDDLPTSFWTSLDRFHIPSRPRLSPPPTRLIHTETRHIELKLVLLKRLKQYCILNHALYDDVLVSTALTKTIHRKTGTIKPTLPAPHTSLKTTIPPKKSPLRESMVYEEECVVDRRDSKMEEEEITSLLTSKSQNAIKLKEWVMNAKHRSASYGVGTHTRGQGVGPARGGLATLWTSFSSAVTKWMYHD